MPILRPAREEDHALYLRLFPELGVDDPPADADRWSREMVADAHVIEEDGVARGYALIQILEGVGYVRQVVVDGAARGKGLGRFAMERIAERLRQGGCTSWCLNVKPDNEPAVRLYRRCGMTEQHRSTSVRLWWSLLDEEAAIEGLADLRCSEPAPEAFAALEQRFGLPPGLLATSAAKERVVLRQAVRGGEPVGLASFDPLFPGCFPFRAADRTAVVALLRALRPHAEPGAAFLQLVLEDAPQLVVELERAGAVRMLDFAHYRGDLGEPAQP